VIQVFAQGYSGADLSTVGNFVQVTDSTTFSGWVMSDFNNFHPSVCFDAKNKVFMVAFTEEWSTSNINNYGYDDFDAIYRTVDPAATPQLGTPVGIATSGVHEAEPCVAYDPGAQSVINAFSFRMTQGGPMQIYLAGSMVASDSGADLSDPQISVDTDAKRLITTWTSGVVSGGSKSVKGMVSNTSAPATVVGSIVAIGTGSSEDHFLARSLYNSSLKNAMLTWTRNAGGSLSVRYRVATTAGAGGLTLLGVEKEASTSSGDEATPVAVYSGQAGESVLFWLKTMSFVSVNSYPGSALAGIYRGKELWFERFK